MALTVTRNYQASTVLTEAQLDAAFDSIEAKFNSTLIAGTEIQSAAIEASHLASNAVTLVKVLDGAFTADASGRAKFADGFVNAAKLGTSAVETAKINDLAVTEGKLAASAVATAKIADGAVTQAKRAALGQQVSSTGGSTNTGTSAADVTGLSVTITTTGRPVLAMMIPTSTSAGVSFSRTDNIMGGTLRLVRGVTTVAINAYSVRAVGATAVSGGGAAPIFYDAPAAGTYTYKIQSTSDYGTNSASFGVANMQLVVFEL